MRSCLLPAMFAGIAALPAVADEPEVATSLQAVTVTATHTERDPAWTPHAVSLVSALEIAEAAAHSTPDLFAFATGVYLQRSNLGGGSPFVRGFTGKQMLILVDGIRVNNSFFRAGPHQYLNTIDPALLGGIEIVRGPASVLYGSDALGGVINLRTQDVAAAPFGGLAVLTADSATAGGSSALRLHGGLGDVGVAGGVSYKRLDDLEAGSGVGRQVPSGYDELAADLKLAVGLGPGRLSLMQHYLDARDVPKTNEVVLGSRARFDYSPQRRSLTALAWDGPLGWFERAHVDLSYTLLDEGERIVDCVTPQPKPCAPADSESVERTRVATPGSASHFTRRLFEAHRLTVGHEYYRDRYDVSKEVIDRDSGAVTPASPGRPDGTIYESLGLFAQDEWQLAPRWELIGGVRYSRFVAEGDGVVNGTRQTLSFESDALTASLYGLYAIAPTLRLVGGIAQGFRAPNIEDAFPQVDFTQFEPNTALEPEHSLTYEVGLKWGLPAYQGELFVYQSDYEDLIARTNIEDGRRQNQNINEATIRGVEFAGRGTLAPGWTTRLTMTYTRGDIRPLNAAECGGTDECPARRIPPFNGAWSLRYMPGLRWFAEADMFFADGQHRLNPGDVSDARIGPRGTPGYVTFGLRGGWNPLPATQLVLVVENLGGRLYKTHGSGIYAPGLSARVAIRQAF